MNSVIMFCLLAGLAIIQSGCNRQPAVNQSGPSAGPSPAYAQGKSDAYAEMEAGRLAFESYGLPRESAGEFARILLERYGIEERSVGGCIVDDQTVDHAKGFNEVMVVAIEERYGKDLFQRTVEEARRGWKEQQTKQP